jgi:hypothetical protein
METKLEDLYMQMITESGKEGTVNTKVKPGQGLEGSDKANIKAVKSPEPTDAEGVKQKKPVEGPSADTKAGEPKPLSKKEQGVKDSVEQEKSPFMTFDQLYTQTITEADEVVPAPDIEGDEFNPEEGDFTGGEEGEMGEEAEEIDIASELRLVADRLIEIADKISVGGEGTEELPEGPVEEMPEEGLTSNESVQQMKEAIVSEPTPKPAKKTTLGPKMSQNPKNKIGKSGAGKASVPTAGKDRTGTPSPAPKTSFGPKMSQNPSGTGPAVKGSNAPLVN